MFACPVCSFEGDGGPSAHEPWCPCFMRGPVSLEGVLTVFDMLEPADERGAEERERVG